MGNWIARVIKGIVIALGFILPGVSGGVLAAVMGLYERMIRFLANPRRDFVKQFLFFLPVAIGGVIGLAVFSRPLEWLLAHWQVIVLWSFAGMVVGTLPALFRQSVATKPRDSADIAWLVGTALLGGIGLFMLPRLGLSLPVTFFGFLIAGMLIALGIIIPGLSPSTLLLILGIFTPMLDGFSSGNVMGVLLPLALGVLLALVLFSKAVEWCLDRYPSRVYHMIIGLVIASTILIVVPTASAEAISYAGVTPLTIVLAALLFAGGLVLAMWMSRLEDKYKVEPPPDTAELSATPRS